jgi:WD40 repeat protein
MIAAGLLLLLLSGGLILTETTGLTTIAKGLLGTPAGDDRPVVAAAPVRVRLRAVLQGHLGTITWVAFSPDGLTLASAGAHGDVALRLWDLASAKQSAVLEGHTHDVHSLSFSPDGKTLASQGWDGFLRLWTVKTGKEYAAVPLARFGFYADYSPDGTIIAACGEKAVKLLDADTRLEKTALDVNGNIRSLAFAPDGKTLAVAIGWETNRNVQFWDTATWKLRGNPDAHRDGAGALAFTHDSKVLASGSHDRTVKLWDVATATELATLQGHTRLIEGVAFSPDGSILASCDAIWREPGLPGEIKLWDVATRKELLSIAHEAGVWCVAFSPDGKTLAAGGGNRTLKLYDVLRGE